MKTNPYVNNWYFNSKLITLFLYNIVYINLKKIVYRVYTELIVLYLVINTKIKL